MSDMPDLTTLLSTPPTSETKAGRDSTKYVFATEYDPQDPNIQNITMTHPAKLQNEKDWKEAVEEKGSMKIPEGYRVRLVEMRYYETAWTRSGQGQDAITKPSWWYRFAVEPVLSKASADEIVAWVNKRKKPTQRKFTGGEYAYHWAAGDLQIGKANETDAEDEGPEGTIKHIVESLERGVDELRALRKIRPIGIVDLAWVGDCLEGNVSQGGRNMWLTSLTVTEQSRIFRRLLMYAIDLFAPLADEVQVNVVNGNHDQMQRFQATRSDDGHATEAAIAVADALELNPAAYGHVRVFVPEKGWGYMTHEVGDTIMTFTHGHQWTKGQATKWWAEQALNMQNPAAAHILLHGHFHEYRVEQKRERAIVCTPTFEERSQWWLEKHGDLSKRGAASFLTLSGDIQFAHIL